ncbi:GGDEF domain-containing protein [Oceanobacillus alkalisoli]|uniref:GGDEF domain-containing protein n=1 Tax=Oceanobacillus alkalisoli TaxID=2925113 RepID=UPI001EE431A6|nr:GGDEF domain-containing protein [Oceanobacillus alkalisoli]MCG5102377.1 GGDEF domain-containing protein [Oceanobacillus alkalisoli]
MWRSFRTKLVMTMVIFAVAIAFVIATINHKRISEQAIQNNAFQLESIEATVEYSLNTIDKTYYYFDDDVAERMKANTKELLELYKNNPSIHTWDMQKLKKKYEMDVYIINQDNVISNSSNEVDIGLDFNECCGKLAEILDSRREAGAFYHDGMDIAQATGEVTKFSYMATPDKKYIMELSYSLEDGEIFEDFNFLSVTDDLEKSYPSINKINILNLGGLALGDPAEDSKLSSEHRAAFEETLAKGETTEVRTLNDKGEATIYHYVPYNSGYDFGSTQNKVIEISYNERELESILQKHNEAFILQLAFILVITVIIALIISKWVSRPMYMAFHDSLTGLRNRAAFEEDLDAILHVSEGETGLLMIDLDHFKSVNDLFGHADGDELLKNMATSIQSTIHSEGKAYRLGGDEFAIVLRNTNRDHATFVAEQVIEAVNESVTEYYKTKGLELSASIGIALVDEEIRDVNEIYKQADRALYESKEGGKNQYRVYG